MTSVDQQQGLATARRPAAARLTLSVVIPCLNEAETIEECVRRARAVMESNAIDLQAVNSRAIRFKTMAERS